jgi:hypothetical protein
LARRRIAETDHSALVGHGNKKSVRDVPAKAKVAISILLTQPKQDLEAAAKAAGLQTYTLRRYLNRPEVMRHLREERKILVAARRCRQSLALKDVRDNSGNAVAGVNAARAIELMQNEMDGPGYGSRHAPQSPGITIVIETPGATAKVLPPPIDVHPDTLAEPDHWPSVD